MDTLNRRRLAEEAARLLLEEGTQDFRHAKRKAAQHLGLDLHGEGPTHLEIEQAVLERNRLFATADSRQEYRDRLRAAVTLLRVLSAWQPRLVGPLRLGILEAQPHIRLHAFADTVEEVLIDLMNRKLRVQTFERQYPPQRAGAAPLRVPGLRFTGPEDLQVEMTVFPWNGIRQAPPSPVDGRPMPRLDLPSVEKLLRAAEENLRSGTSSV